MANVEYFIREEIIKETPVTKRKLLKRVKEEINTQYIARQTLINNRTFAAGQLLQLEKQGKIKNHKFRRCTMYDRAEILKVLKQEKSAPRQTKLF